MCTVKMCLTCRLFLVFLCTFWPFISHFPLLFPFLHNLFLFSWHFRDFLFFELSFSVLHFLVSSSCSSFFFCSSMVDYSFVKVDCPSVSFPFARLGCLLDIVEGKHLKRVSLFMGEDCPYRFVLSSSFPLVSCSTKVARFLKMSREVKSSELETGLSSSDEREVPVVTSPFIPYKAWNILCTLSEGKMRRELGIGFNFLIRLEFGFWVTRIGPIIRILMKSVSTKQISPAVFVFPFTPLLGNFLRICTLPWHN